MSLGMLKTTFGSTSSRRGHLPFSAATAALVLAGAGMPIAAQAQEAGAASSVPAVEEAAADAPSRPSDEIIVTATRRDEAVSTIPISIVAVNQASLDQRGIRTIQDFMRSTPGVVFRQANNGSNFVAIRGIVSTVGAATTGVYLNDTPIQARSIGTSNATSTAYPVLFDLERVEVLRGPQGTLFGAGSVGGTIRFITPEASVTKFSGRARAELAYTEHGDLSYEMGVAGGGPLVTDKIGIRMSGHYRRDGGWIDRVPFNSPAAPNKDDNVRESIVLSAGMKFAVSETFTLTPSVFYQDRDRWGSEDAWDILSDYDDGRYVTGNVLRERESDRFWIASLGGNLDLGGAEIVSNTSYMSRTRTNSADYTSFFASLFTAGAAITAPGVPQFFASLDYGQGQKIFTQELRIQSSNSDSPLKWVIGGFYQHAKQASRNSLPGQFFDEALLALRGRTVVQQYRVPLLPVFGFGLQTGDVVDEQYAGFANVEYEITPWLSASAGVRAAYTKFNYAETGDGPISGGPVSITGRQSEKPITPKFTINVKPDENTLLYANAAKGFRTGGTNSRIPPTCANELAQIGLTTAPEQYQSDSVWSYEAGAKTRLLNNRLRLAASVFHIDWSGIQQSVGLTCGFSFTTNLGKAVSRGADLQVDLNPVDGLDLSLKAAYTDSHYTESVFGGVTATGGRTVIVSEGDELATPPWAVTVSGSYTFPVQDNEAYVRADYDYQSSYQNLPNAPSTSFNARLFRGASVQNVNMRAGYRFNSYDLSVFVNNVMNSADIVRAIQTRVGSPLRREAVQRPRTFGLTGSYRF